MEPRRSEAAKGEDRGNGRSSGLVATFASLWLIPFADLLLRGLSMIGLVGPKKSWAPEHGWPLFFAWMGGAVGSAILFMIIFSVMMGRGYYSLYGWQDRLIFEIPGLIMYAWHASLVLRTRPRRFAMWACLPLLCVAVPNLKYGEYPCPVFLFPLIKAGLLKDVRSRVWVWILAAMAGVIVFQVGGAVCFRFYKQIPSILSATIGFSGSSLFNATLRVGAFSGVWILAEIPAAWALAWKMPPIDRLSTSAASTDEQPTEKIPVTPLKQ